MIWRMDWRGARWASGSGGWEGGGVAGLRCSGVRSNVTWSSLILSSLLLVVTLEALDLSDEPSRWRSLRAALARYSLVRAAELSTWYLYQFLNLMAHGWPATSSVTSSKPGRLWMI